MQFEKDILAIEQKISELNLYPEVNKSQIASLSKKLQKMVHKLYKNLTPWQKVQVARHPDRPKCSDYINTVFTDFVEIRGDRFYGQDNAIITGFAKIGESKVAIIGQEKGKTMEDRIKCNFGMALPDGYRKAQRLMKLADKFALPIITLIDTAGAFPGIESEERGQAEAIASCMEMAFNVSVPIVSIVIGEGGSGGAIAIGVADYVLMLENSIYSVISPEGCASILWRDDKYVETAAISQRLTAEDLKCLGIIDSIILEKPGGAHRNPIDTMMSVKDEIVKYLSLASELDQSERCSRRRTKFVEMGNMFVANR